MDYYFVVLSIDSFVFTTHVFKVGFFSNEMKSLLLSIVEGYVHRSTYTSHSQWTPSVMYGQENPNISLHRVHMMRWLSCEICVH